MHTGLSSMKKQNCGVRLFSNFFCLRCVFLISKQGFDFKREGFVGVNYLNPIFLCGFTTAGSDSTLRPSA